MLWKLLDPDLGPKSKIRIKSELVKCQCSVKCQFKGIKGKTDSSSSIVFVLDILIELDMTVSQLGAFWYIFVVMQVETVSVASKVQRFPRVPRATVTHLSGSVPSEMFVFNLCLMSQIGSEL